MKIEWGSLQLLKGRTRILFALIAASLILSTFYLTALSLTGRTPPREYRYSQAKESAVEVGAVLESIAQTMDPVELSRLRDRLRVVAQLTLIEEDPLGDYLRVLSEFSSNMVEIDLKLHEAQTAISSGDTRQAVADLERLKELREKTEPLPESLYGLLDRVAVYYKVNTSTQMEKIGQLDVSFQEFSIQIDELGDELETEEKLIQTDLSLYALKQEVFIEEIFTVYGFLRNQNGSSLVGRNITVSWAPNMTVIESTDFTGRFESDIFFPIGFAAGLTEIEASFEPEGADAEVYQPSTSMLQVQVEYYATSIRADIYPANANVMDFVSVGGNLSTAEGEPLAFKTVVTLLDGSFLRNMTTNSSGWFSFSFQVPQTLSNGSHLVTVAFAPVADRYAPSNATLPFIVELLDSRLQLRADRTTIFSGTKLTVNGTLTYLNGAGLKYGNVTVYFDGALYGNVTTMDDGSFLFVIQLPIGLSSGSHSVRVVYDPEEPWVRSSEALVQVFVYNTPLLIAAAIGILTVSSSGIYLARRSRRDAMLLPPTLPLPTVEKPLSREEFTPESLLSTIELEGDNASKVRRSYRLAQVLINWKFGEASRESETHWEYYSRVVETAPDIKDLLKRLTELFELSEYSPYPIEDSHSEEAEEILLDLRKQFETVKL